MATHLPSSMRKLCACLMAASLLAVAAPGFATDVDGPDDCVRQIHELGDAPESVLAYPTVIGKFPTCIAPSGPGTQTFAPGCAPISSPPGVTGFVAHFQIAGGPDNYWIGCYPAPVGAMGIDSESDGKVNTPPIGISFCSSIPTDCVEGTFLPLFGLAWDQDECYADGSDAGLTTPPSFTTCTPGSFTVPIWNCVFGVSVPKFLNVLLDMNTDGDWNDNFVCDSPAPGVCAFEWAVKNAPLVLLPGCNIITVPPFPIGPKPGPGWLRITITDFPVPDEFPWAGSAGLGGPSGQFQGGETEDYPVIIEGDVAATPSTWGSVKARYR